MHPCLQSRLPQLTATSKRRHTLLVMTTPPHVSTLTIRHHKPRTTILRIRSILNLMLTLRSTLTIWGTQQQTDLATGAEDGTLASTALLAGNTALVWRPNIAEAEVVGRCILAAVVEDVHDGIAVWAGEDNVAGCACSVVLSRGIGGARCSRRNSDSRQDRRAFSHSCGACEAGRDGDSGWDDRR